MVAILEKYGQLPLRKVHDQGTEPGPGRPPVPELDEVVHLGLTLQERMQSEAAILDCLRQGMTQHDLGILTDALQAAHQTNISRHPQVEPATILAERLKRDCEYEEVQVKG